MGVLIWSSSIIYGEGIEQLLQMRGVRSISVVQPDDEIGFQERLVLDRPSVIIFDEITFSEKPDCILETLLAEVPEMRIVVFNVQDNQLSVYKKVQCTIERLDDFYDSVLVNDVKEGRYNR